MPALMPHGKQRYTDSSGAPLSGGKLYTYAAGTSTPQATYSDSAGTVPNANPVVLDSRGEATIYWSAAAYKVILKTSADVTIWTQDNLEPALPASELSSTAAGKGAALIGYSTLGITVKDALDLKAPLASPALTGTPTAPTASAGDNSTKLATTAYADASAAAAAAIAETAAAPVGMIVMVPGTAAPAGYLKVNGALLSRATYADLYAFAVASGNMAASDGAWVEGQFSPGDGSTTFRIPDARGNHFRGWDDGRGIDSGRTFGSLQLDEIKSHTHPERASGSGGGLLAPAATTTGLTNAETALSTSATGGAENRVRNVAWLVCIKY